MVAFPYFNANQQSMSFYSRPFFGVHPSSQETTTLAELLYLAPQKKTKYMRPLYLGMLLVIIQYSIEKFHTQLS